MAAKDGTRSTMEDFGKYFSSSARLALESLGHDFIEEKREGPYVYDEHGKRFIDCFSSAAVYNLGRRHPAVIAGLREAIRETDQGNFPMISVEKARLAERLAAFSPEGLECAVFSVIRGESVDFACKLARGSTGRREIVTVDGSWFGHTGFAMSLSERRDLEDFGPLIPGVRTIAYGDLAEAAKAVTKYTAALFIEPVQAENGCRAASDEYLAGLRDICTKRGAVLVFDETQSGMGRCGRKFACGHSGVVPDVLVVGEALGGGIFPIAATVFTQRLNRFMNAHPMIHLSTFGGSDLGCRTAVRVLDLMEDLRPWENAEAVGKRLIEGLRAVMGAHPGMIKSVQGRGLLLALELDSAAKAVEFVRELSGRGVLAMAGEVKKSSLILRPSLLIHADDVDAVIGAVAASAQVLEKRP